MNKKQYISPTVTVRPNRIKFRLLSDSIKTTKGVFNSNQGSKQGIGADRFANERIWDTDDQEETTSSIWNF